MGNGQSGRRPKGLEPFPYEVPQNDFIHMFFAEITGDPPKEAADAHLVPAAAPVSAESEADQAYRTRLASQGRPKPTPTPEGEPEPSPGHGVLIDPPHDPWHDLLEPMTGPIEAMAPWAIGPIIAKGDCTYIVGLQNTGKTTLAVDIVWGCLAGPEFDDDEGCGRCLANAWKIDRGQMPHGAKALIINAETTSKAAWMRKFVQRGMHSGVKAMDEIDNEIRSRLTFLDAEKIPWVNRENLRAETVVLADRIAAAGFGIVVIDPIYNFFDANENGDATWVTRGLKPFIRALKEHGVTCLCLAHPSQAAITPKSPLALKLSPFGTSQQLGVIDASFGLQVSRQRSTEIDLILTKSRTRDTQTWIPRFDSQITLTFSKAKGGYDSFKLSKKSNWEYDDPQGTMLLSTTAREMLAQLPSEMKFDRHMVLDSDVKSHRWGKFKDELVRTELLIETIHEELPGKPITYGWTDVGIIQRARAQEDFPDEAKAGVLARTKAQTVDD